MCALKPETALCDVYSLVSPAVKWQNLHPGVCSSSFVGRTQKASHHLGWRKCRNTLRHEDKHILFCVFLPAGVQFVFDTTLAAGFSILECQKEFIQRYRRRHHDSHALPMFTSSCPGKTHTHTSCPIFAFAYIHFCPFIGSNQCAPSDEC